MNTECPQCGGSDFEDTDHGVITPTEIKQDFKCCTCGCKWEVTFTPIAVVVTEKGEDAEAT